MRMTLMTFGPSNFALSLSSLEQSQLSTSICISWIAILIAQRNVCLLKLSVNSSLVDTGFPIHSTFSLFLTLFCPTQYIKIVAQGIRNSKYSL